MEAHKVESALRGAVLHQRNFEHSADTIKSIDDKFIKNESKKKQFLIALAEMLRTYEAPSQVSTKN